MKESWILETQCKITMRSNKVNEAIKKKYKALKALTMFGQKLPLKFGLIT